MGTRLPLSGWPVDKRWQAGQTVAGYARPTIKPLTESPVTPHDCPFCRPEPGRVRLETECAVAIADGFPVAPGHSLVVPRRHVACLFELSEVELASVWTLVARVRALLVAELAPDGFTVGLNDGPAAGQTVMHAHVHVIPRRRGDVPDPRGGVRWVIPHRAAYWAGDRP